MKKNSFKAFCLAIILIGLVVGCKNISLKNGLVNRVASLSTSKKVASIALENVFYEWKFVSGIVNVWYSFRDNKYEKQLEELKNDNTLSWRGKHKIVFERVSYKKEKKDIIYLPKTTYRRKHGDCEDLSALNRKYLGEIIEDTDGQTYKFYGYIALVNIKDSHVVAMYNNGKEENGLLVFDNTNYYYYDNLKDFSKEKKDEYLLYVLLDDSFKYVDFQYLY